MRTIVTVRLRSLWSVCCSDRIRMCVWENPLSLLRCSSSGEPRDPIGRLRAHRASVMRAPALVASRALSLSGSISNRLHTLHAYQHKPLISFSSIILILSPLVFNFLHFFISEQKHILRALLCLDCNILF